MRRLCAYDNGFQKLSRKGIKPTEIGLFVRTRAILDRARKAVRGAGQDACSNSERGDDPAGANLNREHLAKGLEFRAVAVMACDDEIIPLQAFRIEFGCRRGGPR